MLLLKLLPLISTTLSFAHIALAATSKSRIDDVIWSPKRSIANPLITDVGQPALPDPVFIPSLSGSPVVNRSTHNRKKRSPTRAKRTAPSNVPFVGYIQVTKTADKTSVGYLNNPSALGREGITTSTASAVTVSGLGLSDSSGPIEISKTNGPSTTYPFIGVTGYSTTLTNNNQWLGSVGHTAANAPATAMPGTSPALSYQSTVWTYNTVTREFTVQWVNPNGSKVNGVLWFLSNTIYVMATAPTTTATSYAVTLSLSP